jgi:hypothetical protein
MKVQKAITLWMVYLLGKVYRIVINGINEFQCGRKEMENWIERNNVWSVGNVNRFFWSLPWKLFNRVIIFGALQ